MGWALNPAPPPTTAELPGAPGLWLHPPAVPQQGLMLMPGHVFLVPGPTNSSQKPLLGAGTIVTLRMNRDTEK
jgi:hypothetical protein